MTLVLTGLDIEAKAAHAEQLLLDVLGGPEQFAEFDARLLRFDQPDAPSNVQATAHLRVTVKDPDRSKVGRAFSNATQELALGGYAGFHTTTPPTAESAFGVYTPAAIERAAVKHTVVLPDGTAELVPDPPTGEMSATPTEHAGLLPEPGPSRAVPLGTLCGARSGDKGGNANIGVLVRDEESYAWLRGFLTPDRVRSLLGPETTDLVVDVFALPNLLAVNVVVHGLLGAGVASSTRPDPQAKGLGEYLRSRVVQVPDRLLARR